MPVTLMPTKIPSTGHNKELVATSYNAIASVYNAWTKPSHTTRLRYLSKLQCLLPAHASILELGCGAGIPVAQALISAGHRVLGNDISTVQISLAKQNVPDGTAEFVAGDMMQLELPTESLDAVIAMYSIIHLPRDEQPVLLGRIAHWLRPGGHVLMNMGTKDDSGSMVEDWLGRPMYWSGWDEEGNRTMVCAAGLEIVEAVVEVEDGMEVEFLWILARKPAGL